MIDIAWNYKQPAFLHFRHSYAYLLKEMVTILALLNG